MGEAAGCEHLPLRAKFGDARYNVVDSGDTSTSQNRVRSSQWNRMQRDTWILAEDHLRAKMVGTK